MSLPGAVNDESSSDDKQDKSKSIGATTPLPGGQPGAGALSSSETETDSSQARGGSGAAPGRGPPGRGPPGGPPRGSGPPPRGPPRGPPGAAGRGPPPGGIPRGPPGDGGMAGRGPPGAYARGPPGAGERGIPGRGPPMSGAMGARGPPMQAGTGMPPRGPPPMRSAGSAQSMSQNAPQSGRNLPPRGPPRGPPGASVRGGPPPGLVAGRGPPRGAPPAGPPLRNQGGQTFGTLALIIMQGKNLPVKGNDTKVYVTAKLYNEEHSTEVASKNVENPTFGDKFTWKIDSQAQDTKISFRAFKKDANTGKDQLLGGGSISYLPWIVQQEFEGDISLKNSQEKPVGTLKIHAVFEKPGQATIKSGNGNEVPRGPNEKFTDEEIREAFIAFDLDNNNYVGPAEIRHILVNIGENPSDAEIDEMIRMVDKAGDGQISYEEFYAMVTGGKQQQQQQRSTTSPLVGDRSGLPSPSAQPGARAPTGTAPKIQKRNARQSALDEFAKQNHLDPDSIKKAYSRFQQSDKSGEGLIEYSEFCEILQIEPGPLADRLFKLFDKDTSGKIDVKEFMVGLSNFTGASKDEKLRFAFAIYDEENKNSINKEQLVRILMANHLASSEDEVQRKADTIMGQADKEGKGRLSFDDFAYISEKFPNILYPAFNLQQSLSSVMTK